MHFAPRAINYSTTGGLAALELIGARKSCDQLLSAAGDGGIVYYGVEAQNADEWEEGIGIVHAGAPPTLERVAVIESSNADALVNFATGPKLVFITSPSIVQAAAHLHKAPCRVVVTTNVNIASGLAAGSSVGGVTLAAGDRVLLVGQTTASQNGAWVAPTSGAAARPLDFYTGDTARGSIVMILEGSRAGETFICTATAAAKIGTDALPWVSGLTGWTGSASITTVGTITAGVWNGTAIGVAYGGTGASDAATARSNLGVTATGSDTTYCYRANNLSDLANAATARTNLGLGTMATQAASGVTITGGSITGITDLAIADGGTGASDAATARTNLGLGTMATQAASGVTITGGSIAGITDLAIADGGTGSSTAAGARTNLGVTATGADTTYCYRANNLSDLANAATARTNLGLGTIATQAASGVTITGGSISGITDLAIADGGTGASDAATARTNLGLGTMATQAASGVTITGGSIAGITDLAIADGGTGQSTAYAAFDALTVKGANIASAANVNLGTATGVFVDVTNSGTTTISSLQTASAGVLRVVRFAAGLTLTHNATSLILPGGQNITTTANDIGIFASLGSGNWQMVEYLRMDDNVLHKTVTGNEAGTGSGNGGLIASTATAGGNAGIRLASGGTDRFQIGCLGSAGSTSLRFYSYEPAGETFRIDPSRNVAIGSTVAPSAGANCLILGVAGTALTPHSSQCGLYGETISSTTELRAVDGAGNRVTLTPHPPEILDAHAEQLRAVDLDPVLVPWGYRSENDFLGVETFGDVAGALRCVEWLMKQAGKPVELVVERPLPGGPVLTWDERQAACVAKWAAEALAHDKALERWAAQPFWIRDTVSRRPISPGSRPDAHEPPQWLMERLTQSKA